MNWICCMCSNSNKIEFDTCLLCDHIRCDECEIIYENDSEDENWTDFVDILIEEEPW